MGSPPPVNYPTPSAQAETEADAGFAPSPSGPSLCGFGIPLFTFNLGFRIPKFPPFAFPPTFSYFLGLNCDLSNPIDASFAYGGGRVPNINAGADDEDD